jgi:hypothetical protein
VRDEIVFDVCWLSLRDVVRMKKVVFLLTVSCEVSLGVLRWGEVFFLYAVEELEVER